jgi:cell wall-associated NlpC family hydrolase
VNVIASRKSFGNILSLSFAAVFSFASLWVPGYRAQAMPIDNLSGMMQTLVIQSVTTSINSFAFADEKEVQTANDGTVADDQTTDDSNTTGNQPTANDNTATSLQPGTSGDSVKKLQLRLMDLQFFDDSDEATGFYGQQTVDSVKLFQRTNGLSIDGIAGEATLALMYSSKALHYSIKQGDSGTDVASLQRRLKELKYFSGSANGYFGTSTKNALKAFQKRNSLKVDGKAGSDVLDLIYSSKAKKAATSATSTPSNTSTPAKPPNAKSVSGLLEFAQAQLGKRYVSGNEGPNSFDCSGFVFYCLKNSSINVGRLSAKGFSEVDAWTTIKKADLKPGDILFFGLRGSKSVGHTGIYLGNGKMIHCSSSKGKVVIADLSASYWVQNYKTAKRIF